MRPNELPAFDLATAIEQMPESHVHCRDYGHAWRPYTASFNARERCYEQSLRCTRCRTIRQRLLDTHGQVLHSQYVYADGYLVTGMGRLAADAKGEMRLASIQADLSRYQASQAAKDGKS
jgi:hypothetical protein